MLKFSECEKYDMTTFKHIPGSGCGDVGDYVLFEGYAFGDRLLEGVYFRLYKDGHVETNDDWDTNRYLSGLNKTKWMSAAKHHAQGLVGDVGICPKCRKMDIGIDENNQ